jgi:hypothetical protein
MVRMNLLRPYILQPACEPNLGYADRLYFPDVRFSATDQKHLPISLFPGVLPPGVGISVVLTGNCFRGSFGGWSALLTFVRVALLLPSDDKTVQAFTFPVFRKYSAAEAA